MKCGREAEMVIANGNGRSSDMSYVERRRFLWIIFLMGLVLLAMSAFLANATTLVRLPFEDLAQQSTAVARLRCLGSESRWDGREIWTETRFEVLELDKGLLPGLVTVRMLGGRSGHLHSRVDGVPMFRSGEEVYLFLWRRQASRTAFWAGRKEHSASRRMRERESKASRRIRPPLRSSIRERGSFGAAASAICRCRCFG